MAIHGVLVNKMQTLLTALGIIIGVGSVTLMQSIGSSFQNYILTQISSVGTQTMAIVPVGFGLSQARDMESLKFDDFEAIRKLSTVTSYSPVILIPLKVTYKGETASPLLLGAWDAVFHNYGLELEHGRLLNESDQTGAASVAVVAHQTAEDLFGNEDPIGKRIKIGSASFTVVGVLKEVGSIALQELETVVVIPFSNAKALTKQTYLTFISLQAKDNIDLAREDLTLLLRQRHRIQNPQNDPEKDDFEIRSVQQAADIIKTVSVALTAFLSVIAGISLIVGGVGIMNIMLVSVLERTHEIGLRKAVGARKNDILMQFLFEALSLTLFGGLVGLLGGTSLAWIITTVLGHFLGDFPFILPGKAIVMALTMAMGTGLAFGIIPARKAAQMNPIEALRYE